MKDFKKIMFYVLALMPVLLVIYGVGVGLFADTTAGLIPMGSIDVVGGVLSVEANTWADYIITPLGLENTASGGLCSTVLDILEYLKNNAGLPINLPVVLGCFYYIYLFVLFIWDLLFDVLTFVIRKCKEVFNV